VKENGVKESEYLSATGKHRMWLRCRGLGEIHLEFGVSGGYTVPNYYTNPLKPKLV
jgi:hypothetical protein